MASRSIAVYGIDFFRNHSMLGLRRNRWRTVIGGSRVYQSPGCAVHTDRPSLTYSLNRLQKLGTTVEYCVTLNRTDEIDESAVIRVIDYEHPRVTFASLAAAERARALGVVRSTAFAGAWQGNGFHEDGLASGLRAAAAFGVTW